MWPHTTPSNIESILHHQAPLGVDKASSHSRVPAAKIKPPGRFGASVRAGFLVCTGPNNHGFWRVVRIVVALPEHAQAKQQAHADVDAWQDECSFLRILLHL